MIRIICKEVFNNPEGCITGVRYKTFDIEHAELEALLTKERGYYDVSVSGAEVLPSSTSAEKR